MKKITLFILPGCPYCRSALDYVQKLCDEKPEYKAIPCDIIDESRDRPLANKYNYYLVPTFYIGDKKLHEGIVTRDIVGNIFAEALKEK